jgi:lysophospholipase L1-like esterase
VISLGTNDASPWKRVDIKTFSENLPIIFSSFPNSRVILFPPPPVNELTLIPKFKELKNTDIKEYHDTAVKICKEVNIAYLDSWSIFKPVMDNDEHYHEEDGVHFIESDYDVLIENLARLISG